MCVDVCMFTYSSLDFGVGRHERMCLLHYAAGEVANASLLLSVVGVLYLQTDGRDKCYWQHHFFRSFGWELSLSNSHYPLNIFFFYSHCRPRTGSLCPLALHRHRWAAPVWWGWTCSLQGSSPAGLELSRSDLCRSIKGDWLKEGRHHMEDFCFYNICHTFMQIKVSACVLSSFPFYLQLYNMITT